MDTITSQTTAAGVMPMAANPPIEAPASQDNASSSYDAAIRGMLKQNADTISVLILTDGDSDGNGYANYAELKAGLEKSGFTVAMSEEQFNMLVAQYTDRVNADISVDELAEVFKRGALADNGYVARFRFTADNPGQAARWLLQLATGDSDHGYADYARFKAGFESSGIRFNVTDAQFDILVARYTDRISSDMNADELARAFEDGGLAVDENGQVSFRLTGPGVAADAIASVIVRLGKSPGQSLGQNSSDNELADYAGFMAGLEALGIRSGPTPDEFRLLSAQYGARQDGIDAQGLEQAIASGALTIGNGAASIDYEKVFHAAPDGVMTDEAIDILLRCYGDESGRMTPQRLSHAMQEGGLAFVDGKATLSFSAPVIEDVAGRIAEADGSIDTGKLESALRALARPDAVPGKGRRLAVDPVSLALEYLFVSAAIGSIVALLAPKPERAAQPNTAQTAPTRLPPGKLHELLQSPDAQARRIALLAGFENAGYRADLNSDQIDVLFATYGAKHHSLPTAQQLKRMHDDGALTLTGASGISLKFRPVKALHGAIADVLKATAGSDNLIQPAELRAGLGKLGIIVFYDSDADLEALFRKYQDQADATGIRPEKLREALEKGDLILDGNVAFTKAHESKHARYRSSRTGLGDAVIRSVGADKEGNEQSTSDASQGMSDPPQGSGGVQPSGQNPGGASVEPDNGGLQGQGGGDPPRQNNIADRTDGGIYGNPQPQPVDLRGLSDADLSAWYREHAAQIIWSRSGEPQSGDALIAELRRRRNTGLLSDILAGTIAHNDPDAFELIMTGTFDLRLLTENDMRRLLQSEHLMLLSQMSFMAYEWLDYIEDDATLENWVRLGRPDEQRAEAARRIRTQLTSGDDVLNLSDLGLLTMPPIPSLIEDATSHLDLSNNRLTQIELFSPGLTSLRIVNNPLTRLRIESNSLEWLNASDNRLNSLELQTPYLQTLYISRNPLRSVPTNLPRLSDLYMSHTHINFLYGARYPQLSLLQAQESMLRSLGGLDPWHLDYFNLTGNPLRPEEVERIGGVLNSDEFDHNVAASLDWLPPQIQALWQQINVGAEADIFANFLNQLRNSAENMERSADFTGRIANLLKAMAQDPELQSACFALATEGTATCGDGASKAFYDMELAILVNQAAKHDGSKEEQGISQELFRLGQQLYRQELLDRFIQQDVAQRRDAVMRDNPRLSQQYAQNRNELIRAVDKAGHIDEREIYLAYRYRLAAALNLPIRPPAMLFENIAGVTQQHLDRAVQAVQEAEKNDEAVAEFIAELPFWQQHLDRVHADKREQALQQVMFNMDEIETGAASDSSETYLTRMGRLRTEYDQTLNAFYIGMTQQYLGIATDGNAQQTMAGVMSQSTQGTQNGLSATRLATINSLDTEQRRIFLERLNVDPDHEDIDPSLRMILRSEIFEFLRPELPPLGNFTELHALVAQQSGEQIREALVAAGMQLPHEQQEQQEPGER